MLLPIGLAKKLTRSHRVGGAYCEASYGDDMLAGGSHAEQFTSMGLTPNPKLHIVNFLMSAALKGNFVAREVNSEVAPPTCCQFPALRAA